jgi:hypothetical protein
MGIKSPDGRKAQGDRAHCSSLRGRLLAFLPVFSLLLGGCGADTPAQLPRDHVKIQHFTLIPITADPATQPVNEDNRHDEPIYIYLEMYRLRLPFGAISGNDAFWKDVNEQALGATQSRLLFRNGIRTGTASIDNWDYFKKLIDQYPTRSQKSTITGNDGQAVELEIRNGVTGQTIFYYDRDGHLHGRTYDTCDDLLAIHFQPSIRAWANARISLSPIIRATRKRVEYTPLNNPAQVEYVAPEKLYDLGLSADIPPGQFLIIAPSSEAKYPTRIGHVFLVEDAPAGRYELVLVIVPHIYRAREQTLATR